MRGKIYIIAALITIAVSTTILGCSNNNEPRTSPTETVISNESETTDGKNEVVLGDTKTNDSDTNDTAKNEQNNNGVEPIVAKPNEIIDQETVPNNVVQDKPLEEKEVFLTFDDGPSANTVKILKILEEKQVKASFFVVGSNVDKYPDIIKAEDNTGMAVLNHSYTHNYSMYKTIEACMDEFDRTNASIKNILGKDSLPLIRFPGGSDNTVSKANTMKDIRNTFINKGVFYVDWNVSSGDAAAAKVPAETIKNNVINQSSNKKVAVVLMHDAAAKTTTVDALPAIIDALKAKGFVFRTFNDLTPTEKQYMIDKRIINRGADKK